MYDFEVVIEHNGKEVQAKVIDKIIVGYPAYSTTEYVVQFKTGNGTTNRHRFISPKDDIRFIETIKPRRLTIK